MRFSQNSTIFRERRAIPARAFADDWIKRCHRLCRAPEREEHRWEHAKSPRRAGDRLEILSFYEWYSLSVGNRQTTFRGIRHSPLTKPHAPLSFSTLLGTVLPTVTADEISGHPLGLLHDGRTISHQSQQLDCVSARGPAVAELLASGPSHSDRRPVITRVLHRKTRGRAARAS